MTEAVQHPIAPWADAQAQVLILGTMPSPKSRERMMYYGHPQNRFWRTLAALWDEAVPTTPEAAQDFARRHHIALWDVLASCEIQGASDATIVNPVANDIAGLLAQTSIHTIFTTGTKAASLYHKLVEPLTAQAAIALPSTSAANRAHWPDDKLVEAYVAVKNAIEGREECL